MIPIRAVTVLCACLGVGCLVGCVRFTPQPLSAAKSADDFEGRSLAGAGLKEFVQTNSRRPLDPWPPPAWGFTNLVLAAFYYHPDLDVARAKWATAQAGKQVASERPNPTLSVTPAYNTTTLMPSPWVITPSLDIPIETAGKRGYRIAQAAQLSEAARLNIGSTAWQVRSRVRRSLVELWAAGEAGALLREQMGIQSESIRLLEGQLSAGAISSFEVTQARIAADASRIAWRDAERRTAEARVQLADAIGIPVRALDGVELSFQGLSDLPSDPSLPGARRQALLNRPDILAGLAEYAASQSALQLEIARQYPDVHLSPGYEYDQGDNKWSLGASVTLPVLNKNQGAIAQAQARRREAAASFNALQARVLGEIDLALATYRAALLTRSEADATLDNLQKQERRGQAMLGAGEISRGDLAALRLQLGAAAIARLDALTKARQALGQVEDALQSPLGLPPSLLQTLPRSAELTEPKEHL